MASQPGPLTQWPWQKLGNLKYLLLAPWLAHSTRNFMVRKAGERATLDLFIFPIFLLRLLLAQLWITVSRLKTANGKQRIVDKSLEFEQVDRERNWDDQIILTALLYYMANVLIPGVPQAPLWDSKGVLVVIALHTGPVEFLYYWFHRALHHHYLYSRYHSHHHASIVTEPITSVIHPFAEELVYFLLFAIPLVTTALTGIISLAAGFGYLIYIDFMNYMGHCNFEMVPKWLFNAFPPLKYFMYTPSFHSLHHTKFRTNYSLFMPIYDYIYGTMDESSEELYEKSLTKKEEIVDVVHLTHLTTLQSMYHSRIAFASLASKPYSNKCYLWILFPFSYALVFVASIFGTTVTVERNKFKKLHMETWVVPRFTFQYLSGIEKEKINDMIENSILEADKMGAKVISLGLLNQDDELNEYGKLYVKRNPMLKAKIVDGTSLATAVLLNRIPEETESVLLVGRVSKLALSLCLALSHKGIKVEVAHKEKYKILKQKMPPELQSYLVLPQCCESKIWLCGNGTHEKEMKKAREGTHFIPISQFPLKTASGDCFYHCTLAMLAPKAYENLHACENWLPRRAMSAWRVAGIVHALEGWDTHECGDMVTNVDRVWRAALAHGFLPFDATSPAS
ncbi:very-long-chain aldehyde decarbonylase GL1-6-like [Zingiber officinale]|uniref:very-long-chain aldehyde decarbonylase GL1-6-like n=1 Tax=Zingiber officinale TaxID=94328 RepID=UPI001C4CEA62|nr:very-long-chain aldehyde decarbonylase GL1-6-like [Zingiber officinale]